VFCVATVAGDWSVPPNSVTTIVTSVPSPTVLTCTNPLAGIPSTGPESPASYRASVIQAELAAATGMPTLLRTALGNVTGVLKRLVGIRQEGDGWEIIVGGGDPYEVAYAIFSSLFDITTLIGSATPSRNETVSIDNFPDTYTVVFVNPEQQEVAVSLVWDTTSPNFVSDAAIAALGAPALLDYVNAIFVGQPINLFEMQRVFQEAVATVLPAYLLSRIDIEIDIDGVPTPPEPDTGLIFGDPEGYFLSNLSLISVTRAL
jgi:hypothetical protein